MISVKLGLSNCKQNQHPPLKTFTGSAVNVYGQSSIDFELDRSNYTWNFYVVDLKNTDYDGIIGWDFCSSFPDVFLSLMKTLSTKDSSVAVNAISESSDNELDMTESPCLDSFSVFKLPTNTPSEFIPLMEEFRELFSENIRRSKLGNHSITLTSEIPVRTPPRRVPLCYVEEVT